MTGKDTYTVRSPVRYGGKTYPVGAPIELDGETAAGLLEARAITRPGDSDDSVQAPARTQPASAEADALAEREAAVKEREEELTAREGQVGEREQAVELREKALEGLQSDDGVRLAVLKHAARKVLAGKAEADLMKDGKPKTEAIEREAFGFQISAKERDTLFEELQTAAGGQ